MVFWEADVMDLSLNYQAETRRLEDAHDLGTKAVEAQDRYKIHKMRVGIPSLEEGFFQVLERESLSRVRQK